MFLQGFEHVTQSLAEIGGGQVAGTAEDDTFLVPLGEAVEENGEDGSRVRPLGDGDAVGQAGHRRGRVGQPMPVKARVEHRAQVRDRLGLGVVRQVHGRLLHPAGVGDEHEQHPLRGERDQLDVPDRRPGQRRVLHDRDLPGELGEQPHRARHDVVEAVGAGQERLDRPPLGGRHRLDGRQPVDEQPVSLVGRDPSGARVRLGDEPLLLEHGHVVADRGRGDVEAVPVDQRLRSHRLGGGHVVLDDRAEHRQLALVKHRVTSLALTIPECQFY